MMSAEPIIEAITPPLVRGISSKEKVADFSYRSLDEYKALYQEMKQISDIVKSDVGEASVVAVYLGNKTNPELRVVKKIPFKAWETDD